MTLSNHKLKLNDLKVKSFITTLGKSEERTIEGMEDAYIVGSRIVCFFKWIFKKKKPFLEKIDPDVEAKRLSFYPYVCPTAVVLNCTQKAG